MAKRNLFDLCNYTECKKKWGCKRYFTPKEKGQEKTDLSNKCNESNSYELYIDWKSKRGKKDD